MLFGFLFKKKKPAQKQKPQKPQGELIGKITHYFPKVKVGVIKITKKSLSLGDEVRILGHTTDFSQKITSMEIDHKPIKRAVKGKSVGVKLKKRVRKKDKVYKLGV